MNVLLRCSWVLSITSPGHLGITLDTEVLKVCSCRFIAILHCFCRYFVAL
jgi:hypothetical protein